MVRERISLLRILICFARIVPTADQCIQHSLWQIVPDHSIAKTRGESHAYLITLVRVEKTFLLIPRRGGVALT
jgi:hypothetical protein